VVLSKDSLRELYYGGSSSNPALLNSVKNLSSSSVAVILSSLLKGKDGILSGSSDAENAKTNSASESALAIPVSQMDAQQMQIAAALSQIIGNPTEGQKVALNTLRALIAEVEILNKESKSSLLKNASDELMKVVASILIAQAIPDLLKEGDIANIKGIFEELNTSKERIMLKYNGSVKPYYEEVKKLLLKNMAVLQLNSILSKNMVEQELADLEPNEVDKILDKIKKSEKRSFEEDYILQQEAKYRNQYIDPSKKLLEEKMKLMMKTFTGRLAKTLEGVNNDKR
jgi:hypothetical protein